MIASDLIVAICLAIAVVIVAAAFVWALLETRQPSARRRKYRPPRHRKSHKQSLKIQDR